MLHWHCKVLTTVIEPIHKCSCSRKWTSPSVILYLRYKVSNSLNRRVQLFGDNVLLECLDAIKRGKENNLSLKATKLQNRFCFWQSGPWWDDEPQHWKKRQGAACRLDWTHSVLIPRRFRSYRKTVTLPGSVHNIFGRNLATKSSELKDIKPLEAQNGQND